MSRHSAPSAPEEAHGELYAICVPRGLEEVVVRHMAGTPGVSEADLLSDGAVELRFTGPLARIGECRAVEGVYRRIGVFLSSRNPDEIMRNLLEAADFRAWKGDRGFALVVSIDPALDVRPREFQAELSWALQAILRARPVPGGRKIHVSIGAEAGWVGVSCGATAAGSHVEGGPDSLPPAVAAGMVLWAGIQADDRVLDPLCGSGRILQERAIAGPASAILGGDADPEALLSARKRLSGAGRKSILCRWDPRRIPVKRRSIDTVLSHFPSGRKIGSRQVAKSLYHDLLREIGSVLRPTGRAVLLAEEPDILFEQLNRHPEFGVEVQRRVVSGKFRADLFLLRPVLKLL